MTAQYTFIKKIFLVIVITAVTIGSAGVMFPKYKKLKALQKQRDQLSERQQGTQLNIDDLRQQQRLFKTDANFVERVARHNHYVRPNETLILMRD